MGMEVSTVHAQAQAQIRSTFSNPHTPIHMPIHMPIPTHSHFTIKQHKAPTSHTKPQSPRCKTIDSLRFYTKAAPRIKTTRKKLHSPRTPTAKNQDQQPTANSQGKKEKQHTVHAHTWINKPVFSTPLPTLSHLASPGKGRDEDRDEDEDTTTTITTSTSDTR